jgi:hypothetical protein
LTAAGRELADRLIEVHAPANQRQLLARLLGTLDG